MEAKYITADIDQLMAQADALVHQINAKFLEELEETHRIQFERHVQRLKSIKAKAEKKAASEGDHYGEGIHEAIVDIVKAMKNLAGYLS